MLVGIFFIKTTSIVVTATHVVTVDFTATRDPGNPGVQRTLEGQRATQRYYTYTPYR